MKTFIKKFTIIIIILLFSHSALAFPRFRTIKSKFLKKVNQINCSIVVEGTPSKADMKLIVKELVAYFKIQGFSNIAISGYRDNSIGRHLAKDYFYEPSLKLIKYNWLFLYSKIRGDEIISFRPWDLSDDGIKVDFYKKSKYIVKFGGTKLKPYFK